jgi:hypothetical protein
VTTMHEFDGSYGLYEMTKQELDILLDKLGLKVPDIERDELLAAFPFIKKMADSVKKPLLDLTEPAHLVSLPKGVE